MEQAVGNINNLWGLIAVLIVAIGVPLINSFIKGREMKREIAKQKEVIKAQRSELAIRTKEEEDKYRRDVAHLFGCLHHLRITLQAKRAYIVQPHPKGKYEYVSIKFEVKENGLEDIRHYVDSLSMSDMPLFVSELERKEFFYYDDISKVKDDKARSIMYRIGSEVIAIKRLTLPNGSWVGSLFVEFDESNPLSIDYMRGCMYEIASKTQYDLPEIKD